MHKTPVKRSTRASLECPPAPKKKPAESSLTPNGRVLILGSDGKSRWEILQSEMEDGHWNITFEELKRIVGGYIESIPAELFNKKLPSLGRLPGYQWVVYLNEEGRLKNLPANPFGPEHVGDAILAFTNYNNGCTVGISEAAARQLPKKFLPK